MKIPRDWTADKASTVISILHEIADAVWDEHGGAIAFLRDLQSEEPTPRTSPQPDEREDSGFTDDEIPF